jgi:hypothetical protein
MKRWIVGLLAVIGVGAAVGVMIRFANIIFPIIIIVFFGLLIWGIIKDPRGADWFH